MKSRRGFVAAVGIFAIVIIAAVIASITFNISQETNITAAATWNDKADDLAETLANTALTAWACDSCDQMPQGSVIKVESQAPPPLEGTVYFTRLDSALYLITAEGRVKTSAGVLARRRISLTAVARRDSTGAVHAARTRGEFWASIYQM